MPKQRIFGWHPDMPDARDYQLRVPKAVRQALPPRYDLRPSMRPVPVSDQGQLGSCVANAWADTMEFLMVAQGKRHEDLSRLFVYWLARQREGTVQVDAGCMVRSGAKALAQTGVCHERTWPYVISRFKQEPSAASYQQAPNHKIVVYQRVLNLQQLKVCVTQRAPVVGGFPVYSSFMSAEVERTGRAPMPVVSGRGREELYGGHAVVFVGYDDAIDYSGSRSGRGVVICRNSWGANWGLSGYFMLPYPFFTSELVSDMWVISQAQFV